MCWVWQITFLSKPLQDSLNHIRECRNCPSSTAAFVYIRWCFKFYLLITQLCIHISKCSFFQHSPRQVQRDFLGCCRIWPPSGVTGCSSRAKCFGSHGRDVCLNTENQCENMFKKTPNPPTPKNHPNNWQLISAVSFGLLQTFCQLHSRLKFVCFVVVPTLSCKEKSKGFFDVLIIQETWNWIKTDMLVQDYGALPDLCRKKV